MYPYTAGGTGLTACLPPWASADGKLFDNLAEPEVRAKIRAEVRAPDVRVGEPVRTRDARGCAGPRPEDAREPASTSASACPRSPR